MWSLSNGLFPKLLARLESKSGLDLKYLAHGGFWTSTRFAIGIAGSFATTIAFGNLLPKETYGTYNYLLSLAGSLSFLTLSGVSIAVIRAVAKGYESIVPYAVRLQLKYNLLAMATIAMGGIYYGMKGNWTFALSLFVLAISIPTGAAFFTYESVLIGLKRFNALTRITLVTTIIGAVAIVATIALTSNLFIIILVSALSSLIPTILIYRGVVKTLKTEEDASDHVSEFRRTTFHLTGAGLLSSAATYLDKIILFQVAGPVALATYGFAIAGPEKLKGLSKNWMNIVLPKLAEKSVHEIRSIFYKRLVYLILVGGLLAGVYILATPFLFKLLLPKYLSSIFYSQIYAISLVIIPTLVYIGNVFYGLNLLRAVYIHSVGTQIIRILLILILGWYWHTMGIVIASVMGYGLSTVYGIIIFEFEVARLRKGYDILLKK